MKIKYNLGLALAIFLFPMLSFSQNIDEVVLEDQQNLQVDKNVKLIGPPINLPKDKYIVPEVSEKEKYTIKTKKQKKASKSKNKDEKNHKNKRKIVVKTTKKR